MMFKAGILLSLLLCCTSGKLQAQSNYIKVHFLYGSKPAREFRDTESKWFGGKLGGHVGIELDSNEVVNFLPRGKFHILAHRKNKHSTFTTHTREQFWEVLGGEADQVKKTTITIPITEVQSQYLDSLFKHYQQEAPYDYAFLGMRCGASTYEILAQIDLLKRLSYRATIFKIFYPKRLRKRLLKKAEVNGWLIEKAPGSTTRKWEQD